MINKVAVLMGGISAERKVSLNSGEQCSNALQEAGYVVNKINVTDTRFAQPTSHTLYPFWCSGISSSNE
jgi:D-alanine-D-alanine ligase-like ATP-grasp enzyme